MSRRHTSNLHPPRRLRALAVALGIALLLSATLPGLVAAQDGAGGRALEHNWQLLTYRSAGVNAPGADLEPVPAGIGATLLFVGGGEALGNAACSSYQTRYNVEGQNLFIFPTEPQYVECDPASRAFDDVFYELLWNTASYQLTSSILVLKDAVGEQLLAFTRAEIDDDPTVARWDLARISGADGSVEPVIAGLDPWVEFLRGGSIVGSTGCGSFFGRYQTNDGTIDITDVRYRLGACTDGATSQAERILSTFAEITRFEVLPAGLRLQDENGTTRLALTPVIELDARTWTPTAVYGPNGEVLVEGQPLTTSAVKLFKETADGGTICRPYTARGLRSGLALTVRNIKLQGKKCKKPRNANQVNGRAVERDFLQALKATASHALRGSELEFKDVDGNTVMRLEPQAELIGPTWVLDWLGRRRDDVVGDLPLTATFTDAGLIVGDTGVADRSGVTNSYLADFHTPQATRIEISNVEAGRFCRGKRAKEAICQQEKTFLRLLGEADRYIARDTDLKLFRGTDEVMRFIPEYLITSDEE